MNPKHTPKVDVPVDKKVVLEKKEEIKNDIKETVKEIKTDKPVMPTESSVGEKRKRTPIYTPKSAEDWWENLTPGWGKLFGTLVGASGKPTKEQLDKIINLKSLIVSYNKEIEDLNPLVYLKNLEELWCSNTKIDSLEPLRNLKNLRILRMKKTEITTLDPIHDLQIKKISLNQSQFAHQEISGFIAENTECEFID